MELVGAPGGQKQSVFYQQIEYGVLKYTQLLSNPVKNQTSSLIPHLARAIFSTPEIQDGG